MAFENCRSARLRMIAKLKSIAKKSNAKRIVFVYEASAQGYGLSDLLHESGIECHVLSPTHLPKTPKSAKQKTDSKDAQMLLEQVRGFVLAGNDLPTCWIPPQRVRDDRELLRARVDIGDELTRIKLRINSMLKRRQIEKPEYYKSKLSQRALAWLRKTAAELDPAVGPALECLVDQVECIHGQIKKLDRAIELLSQSERYADACNAITKLPGVGLLSAMTFLTELGDLTRFSNRRELGAYLGLCPSIFETGLADDRKGRITRQGSSRVRKILCQAAWSSLMHSDEARETYHRIRQGQKKRNKKALVALMRKLGIKMWHIGCSKGDFTSLQGRGGPHDLNFATESG